MAQCSGVQTEAAEWEVQLWPGPARKWERSAPGESPTFSWEAGEEVPQGKAGRKCQGQSVAEGLVKNVTKSSRKVKKGRRAFGGLRN